MQSIVTQVMQGAPVRWHESHVRLFSSLLLVLLGAFVGGCAASGPRSNLFPPTPQYPPDHAYTLDELVELSIHRNAGLDVARYEAAAAQGIVDQVKALWLPSLRYDLAITGYDNDLSYPARAFGGLVKLDVPITGAYNITNTLLASQIMFTGGKRLSGLKQAKMYAELKRIDVLRAQDALCYDVATYYQLVCLTNDIDTVLEDALRRIRVLSQVAHELSSRGTLRGNNLDALQSELFISFLEQLQVAVRAGRQQAYTALKQSVGLNPDEPLTLARVTLPLLLTEQERISVLNAVGEGFLARPETREVELFARIRAEQVNFAKKAYAPNVVAGASFVYVAGNHNTILGALDGLIAGLLIDVPIYDPARLARLREALGMERAAEAFQKMVEQLVTLEISVTAVEAQKSLASLAPAEHARLAAAEHYDATRQAYSRELVPASNVVIAIGIDAVSRVNSLTALFNYHNARARLKRVTADRETPYGY